MKVGGRVIAQVEHGFLAAGKVGRETTDPSVWACGLQSGFHTDPTSLPGRRIPHDKRWGGNPLWSAPSGSAPYSHPRQHLADKGSEPSSPHRTSDRAR